MQMSDTDIIGAVKIKDGLFIGDEYAAQDLEFVVTNKVTHVVNCAGKQIPNHWEAIGVIYLTLNWLETDYQVLFDTKDEVLNELYKFIEGALTKGESILVHSVKGQNRSCCVLGSYFMKKYRWTLYKTLEYLHSRKPNLEIRSNFFTQLMNLENKLSKMGQGAKTYNWNEVGDDPKNMDSEELLLTNTFLNSKKLPPADLSNVNLFKEGKTRLNWNDLLTQTQGNRNMSASDGFHLNKRGGGGGKDAPNAGKSIIKSILKGSNKVFQVRPTVDELTSKGPSVSIGSGLPKQVMTKSPSVASNLKDPSSGGISLMRPGSASGSMLKSNSVSVLEKASADNDKMSNIQGNIIHITVNNFITNNNLTNNNGPSINNKIKIDAAEKSGQLGTLKTGLTGTSSNKDLTSLMSTSSGRPGSSSGAKDLLTDKEKNKRGYSPSTTISTGTEKSKLSFQLDDKPDYKKDIRDGDDSPMTLSSKNKFGSTASSKDLTSTLNGSLKQAPINMYGSQQAQGKQIGFFTDRKTGLKSLSQQFEREMTIPNNNTFGGVKFPGPQQNNDISVGKGNSSLYKYLTQPRAPVKATVELNPKQTKRNESEIDFSGSNFMKNQLNGTASSKDNKQSAPARPATAPENIAKFSSSKKPQESPYYSSTLTVYGRTNKNLESTSSSQRQGSAQPIKDLNSTGGNMNSSSSINNNKAQQIEKDAKARLRSSSPGNVNTLSYFQELSNKPKWKY